ncbi:MAG: SDR family oxidoreductase [Neomegalonema sp.]|nr:SDR family oxidoreductase [Neomegalonema sp.]
MPGDVRMKHLDPKRLLITGAGRGIGAATARLGGARGWRCVINYRKDRDAAEVTAAQVRVAGGEAILAQGDVADAAEIARIFDDAEEAFGGLDAVIINAGVLFSRMPLAEMDPERIRRTVDVNVTGALLTAREAALRLKQGGSITLLSSAAARLGSPNEFVDYAATKGAMDTLTRGLAAELGPRGIRVNAVRPGLIETDIHIDAGWPERAQALASGIPMQRPGSAEEVAQSIIWLTSDEASYVSGALLDVSGGR